MSTDLRFDPLLMSPRERTRRIRELDLATNEALELLKSGKPGAADEAQALLQDVHNPDGRPDRSRLVRAVGAAGLLEGDPTE